MSVQMVIELSNRNGAQTVLDAVETYKACLKASIQRTRRKLSDLEHRYNVTTEHFLADMAAEDLEGGDLEYVEWAGEDKLLVGLEAELRELENAHFQLS
ncbi:MAG: hypothetical protein KKD28_06775 [Chloroflexi bacterium]|nr:hypothetical protein [Chloroflexota bacterium]MBU1661160.1 hypothetical protein [Chloroflexota bacterium]